MPADSMNKSTSSGGSGVLPGFGPALFLSSSGSLSPCTVDSTLGLPSLQKFTSCPACDVRGTRTSQQHHPVRGGRP